MNDAADIGSLEAAELAERIASGDPAAETELVRRYSRPLRFILLKRVREASLADDLCQEALIVVLERLRGRGLEEPDKLTAFIRQTAINLAIGEARTHYRRDTHPDSERIDSAAARQPLLSEQLEQAQLAALMDRLMNELRQARDRQILRRFYLSEESKASLCSALGVTPEHFDRVLFRARQRFGKILERHAREWK